MFELIIIIIIIYYFAKKIKISSNNNTFLFYRVMKCQGFNNVKNILNKSQYSYTQANCKGENFLFEIRYDSSPIGSLEINSLYEMAKRLHIHNCVLIIANNEITPQVQREIEDYNIEIWNTEKLQSLIANSNSEIEVNTYKSNILKTSNTSNDKCKIEPSYDPIREGQSAKKSIFSGIFEKPDRL